MEIQFWGILDNYLFYLYTPFESITIQKCLKFMQILGLKCSFENTVVFTDGDVQFKLYPSKPKTAVCGENEDQCFVRKTAFVNGGENINLWVVKIFKFLIFLKIYRGQIQIFILLKLYL